MKAKSVNGRNYGINFLRIVAMMLMVLHALGNGGIFT